MATVELTAQEALARLADTAELSMDDFFTAGADGKPYFDFPKAKRRGKLHLIRGFTEGPSGDLVPLFVSSERAILTTLKLAGLMIARAKVDVAVQRPSLKAKEEV